MKKLVVLGGLLALAANASAYFSGGASMTSGPDGYRGTDLSLLYGNGAIFIRPGLSSYNWDGLKDPYNVFRFRGGLEKDLYTLAGEAGFSQKNAGLQYTYFGADMTVSLTPGGGGRTRLAGPGSGYGGSSGKGVTRIDVGVGAKRHTYSSDVNNLSGETGQNEFSVFAGAKILMVQVGASFTGYGYGADKVPPYLNLMPGQTFVIGGTPKSSVNLKTDLMGLPMVTPYASYTATKYKNGGENTSTLGLGAYLDLSMVSVSLLYQLFDGTDNHSYLNLSAGLKF